MALADGDIIRITDKQSLSGQDILNVFFYVVDILVAGVTLADLITEFKDQIVEIIRDVQAIELNHARLIAENLTNGIDIDSSTINLVGTDTTGGTVLPSYVAGSYRLFVDDKTTRRGSKRIGGIGEDRVSQDNYDPDLTANALVNAALSANIEVAHIPSGDATFTPIVVGRDEFGDLELGRFSVVTSAASSETISSQVSRKAPLL